MRRIILFFVAAAVLVVVGVGGWYLFIRKEPDKFTLSTPTSTQTKKSAAELAGTWRPATTDSRAGYRVREKLARLPAQSDAVGRTSAITGEVTLEASGDTLRATAASFEVDVTKLASDRSQRDNSIRRQGLESNRYPTAAFKATAPIDVPANVLVGGTAKVQATGDLTIHGQTKPVTLDLDVQLNGERIELVGNYKFGFSQFDMTPPSIGGVVSVEPEATLELHVFLTKAA